MTSRLRRLFPFVEELVGDIEGRLDVEVCLVNGAWTACGAEMVRKSSREGVDGGKIRTKKHYGDGAVERDEGVKRSPTKLVLKRGVRPAFALFTVYAGIDGSSD
jgi:hypothetical protein